jgi:dolichol-phosphate mannosyltransferase
MSEDRVLVVVPTYNERQNLEALVGGIRRHRPDAHILFVDDNSPDGTAALADELSARLGGIQVLRRAQRLGIGSAYRAGFHRGLEQDYTLFISMDGDLSHDPEYLPELIAEAQAGADVVIGSRYLHGVSVVNWSLDRLVLSVGGNTYARLVARLPVRDCTSGFQCFRRRVLETIGVDGVRSNGYAFLVELKWLAHRRGFRLKEIPIIFVDRRMGKSKNGVATVFRSMWTVTLLGLRRA